MTTNSRQERLLMRQRGAGNREINNIDFGFAFTTPSQLHRSRTRSRTPQTATRNVRQSTRTPKDSQRSHIDEALSTTHSNRTTHFTILEETANTHDIDSGLRPRKRRRLSEISNLTSITNATNVSRDLGNARIGILSEVEEDALDEPSSVHVHKNNHELEIPVQKLGEADIADKENDTSILSTASHQSKRRKRKSIGQQRQKMKREPLQRVTPNSQTLETPLHTSDVKSPIEWNPELDTALDTMEGPAGGFDEPLEHTTLNETTSLPQPTSKETIAEPGRPVLSKRQRKRRSILFTRKKRRSTETNDQTSVAVTEDNEISDNNTQSPVNLRRSKSRSDSGFEEGEADHEHARELVKADFEDSEDSDQDYRPDETSPKLTPAPIHKNRQNKFRHKGKADGQPRTTSPQPRLDKHSKSTFPVLTHRITNLQLLPTIEEASETEHTSQEDAFHIPSSITTNETPNAIDVLAQICRETVDSAVSTLQTQLLTGKLPKAQLKQDVMALDAFRSQIETQLFDISQTLDQRLQLEARLRKSKREKALVQSQWMDIQKRRDQIALHIDAVRRQHWENEVIGKKAWAASEAARALEVEVQKCNDNRESEDADEGRSLEIMLRNLVGAVSSSHGHGVLQKLKSFNAQLERFTSSCDTV